SSLSEYVDVIIDGRETEIDFVLNVLAEKSQRLPEFLNSDENRLWYNYLGVERNALGKIVLMEQLLAAWPNTNDSLYLQVATARQQEIARLEQERDSFIAQRPESWSAAMVANRPHFFANPRDDWRLQDLYRRQQYWQHINTSRPELLNTPLYTEHILNYIQYYMNPEMAFTDEQMIKGFKASVDTIISRFSGNEETHSFAIRYLQLGFKEIGMEEVLQYIDQNYAADQCLDEADDNALQVRLRGYEAMKPGSAAPDISWAMPDGSLTGLYQLQAETTLLVFWASWCPHCMEMMPKLNDWAARQENLQVLAISLNNDSRAYASAAEQYNQMLHYNDFQGWESQPVKEYFVYGTPSFYLLDADKHLLGKFSGFDRLKDFYEERKDVEE
ncbi:MAG: redoxin family protein, partial [Bacteroidales bacterium]|nr:redoxin family protein [Bacteroidales bacterium]